MKVKTYHKSTHRQAPVILPETQTERKAKHLPMPGPDIKVTVPLHLVPAYLSLYGLKPTAWSDPDTLIVKREVEEVIG